MLTKIMLIAPIGTREIRLADEKLLPDEVQARWSHADVRERLGAREKGALLRADLARYGPSLQLQIVGKAVRHLLLVHGRLDRLLLVASDQPTPETPDHYRKNDTVELARLFKELLLLDPKMAKVGRVTKIELVRHNPADYEAMRTFYREMLPRRTGELDQDGGICYLEVTGGTSQMSIMLLLEGMRLLRTRAVPLYALQEIDMPLHLNVGQLILVDDLCETVARDIGIYAYHAAWKSCVAADQSIRNSIPQMDALIAVLESARHRLNFDFEAAQRALFGAERTLPSALKGAMLQLADDLSESARTEAWLIAEVYQSARVQLEIEAYAGFVGRIFRLQEALLRYLCEQWGARFQSGQSSLLDQAWLRDSELVEGLVALDVAIERPVSRRTLQILALELARRGGDEQGIGWVTELAKLEQLTMLRNQTVITHGFAGISRATLDRACGKGRGIDVVVDGLGQLLHESLGVDPGLSPYAAINELCLQLVEGG